MTLCLIGRTVAVRKVKLAYLIRTNILKCAEWGLLDVWVDFVPVANCTSRLHAWEFSHWFFEHKMPDCCLNVVESEVGANRGRSGESYVYLKACKPLSNDAELHVTGAHGLQSIGNAGSGLA